MWLATWFLGYFKGIFVFCVLSNVNVCFIFSFLSINRQGHLMDTQFLSGFKIL